MENRAASRTYGSIDDPASKSRSSSSPELSSYAHQQTSRESLLGEAHGDGGDASERTHGYSRGRWVAVAAACAMGVGTILATNRSGFASPPLDPAHMTGSSPTTEGRSDGSILLAESLATGGTMQPKASAKGPNVAATTEEGGLGFSVTNFYHTRDGKPGALIPWLEGVHLAEPYRETTMTVENPREDHEYMWEVHQLDSGGTVLAVAPGVETTVVFTGLDRSAVTLREVDASGFVTRKLTDTVMVKYVRREIRTLTDDERNELLDSMAVLWNTRVMGGNGKEIYGEDYADIWAINRLHFTAAGGSDCDHFHDGLGFLTSHSMMTNTFEYSLQVVNPKLTMPYWDFTIESSTAGGNTEDIIEPQSTSPLFGSDWFGYHDSDDNQLKDGRWANTLIPRMKLNNPGGVEPDVYSKLRAPWNVNNREYLSRSMGSMCGVRVEEYYPWPNCKSHYDLTTSYSDYYSWVWDSLYDPHGPVHIWLGGVMDCDETYAKITSLVGKEISAELAYYSFVHRKNLFRSGFFQCTATAEVDETPGEVLQSGKCGCQGYDLKTGDDYKVIMNSMVFVESYIGDFDEDTQRSVVDSLCNGLMNDGDHLQASSSLDPSFWVTHPTMERLWMFKRLTGTMTDLTWPDEDTYVLDPETGTTELEVLSLYGDSCTGHGGSDIFPFGLAMDDGNPGFMARTAIKGDEEHGNILTNREILQALDPRVNKMSYIYDTFEWEHCLEDGVNMDDAWTSGVTESQKPSGKKAGTKRPTFKQGEVRYPMYDMFRKKAEEVARKPLPGL